MFTDIVLPFPIYAIAWKGTKLVIGGGGGVVKTGISNGLV